MSNEEIKELESVATKRTPSRVKKFKEEYINDNAVLRQENHALKCGIDKVAQLNATLLNNVNHPSIRFAIGLLVKAIVGNKEV